MVYKLDTKIKVLRLKGGQICQLLDWSNLAVITNSTARCLRVAKPISSLAELEAVKLPSALQSSR